MRDLETVIARDVADAILTATSPLEVYRLALARVTPTVGASFASVFLRDPDEPRLLRLACAWNWPQATARFLSEIRVREGRGPTGRAVLQGESVEIEDVFADDALEEWWEPARELGFVSMTAHPLVVEERVFGALSFYYQERQRFDEDAHTLLTVVTHQLASTARRAHVVPDLGPGSLRAERTGEALLQQLPESSPDGVRSDRSGPAAESR